MSKNRFFSRRKLAAALLFLPLFLVGQDPPTPQNPQPPPAAPATPASRTTPPIAPRPSGPKKYEDVITSKAKTKDGLFKVHSLDDKFYYEIPENLYSRDMLMYNEIAQAPPGVGYSGSPGSSRMIRWERRGNRIFLRANPNTKRATDGDPSTKLSVELSSFQPIIRTFNIEAEGKDKSAVIDVTPMFSTDIPEFSAISLLAGLRLPTAPQPDPSRSFIEDIKAFPENIETRTTLTWNFGTPPLPPVTPNAPAPARIPNNFRSLSVMVHFSMVLLPEKPRVGRNFDPRVGYFIQPFEEYANDENRVETKGFITRFPLDKKDPGAALSEPVKPIVFYIAREVPDVWKPYIRRGVEAWNVAFEQAGFKNAIVAKDAPTKEQDPDWDAEDVRYSVIRWAALPVENAMGPHVHDPRSGEILSAHIILWHDVLKLGQAWYFGMCSAQNDAARKLPFDKQLMGEILLYIASHEVGHTLGLRHNQKASSAYSIAQLRDPAFTKDHGSVASIMAYGRFNYVAQPEDNVRQLMPLIAPYDRFAIEWGYKPLAGVKAPDDEKQALDQIAARQIDNPFLRFGGEDGPAIIDPTVKTENIGDDPVLATTLGFKNLERVINGWLIKATTKPGENFDLLKDTFNDVWTLRRLWLGSVVRMVGGVVESRTLSGRGGDQFARVPREKQKEAVRFLHEQVFVPPTNLIKPELLNQFQYFGAADIIISQQKQTLETLLSPMRFKLLTDGEAMNGKLAYPLREFMADVQIGLFSEIAKPAPTIDLYRRAIQRNYIDHLKNLLNRPPPPVNLAALPGNSEMAAIMGASWQQTDFRGTARSLLEQLNRNVASAILTARDPATSTHLKDCRREIELILDPKKG